MKVGIEKINFFGGLARLDVRTLAEARGLDMQRFDNLLMKEKTVPLQFEDPITYAVNAAKPIINDLSEEEKNKIEMVITATESSIDFGKSLSTYVHQHLGLNRNCRLFELKQACYSGMAAFQMAINHILSQTSIDAKVLVIATDIARFMVEEAGDALSEDWSFAEPSSGAGAMAVLVSQKPKIFQVDAGANGFYGYQVMDTCRPTPDSEAGDSDLSLLSYLDCCENAFREYTKRVEGADYRNTFNLLSFHTPFGGMVKGAHRQMMKKFSDAKAKEIEEDFKRRVEPSMMYCQRVGNIMGATALFSLLSAIDNAEIDSAQRIGVFSYGSGCCSEFISGIFDVNSQEQLNKRNISDQLNKRYSLNMQQYDGLLRSNNNLRFGTRNVEVGDSGLPEVREAIEGRGVMILKSIKEF